MTRSGVQLFWYFNADLIIHLAALNSFKIYRWVDPYLTQDVAVNQLVDDEAAE